MYKMNFALTLLLVIIMILSRAHSSASSIGGHIPSSAETRFKSGSAQSKKFPETPVEDTASTSAKHLTKFIAECALPTKIGSFRMRSYVYTSDIQNLEPVVLIHGDIAGKQDVLVRIHDQCFTSEVLGSLRCDCREQLEKSMGLIREQGGVLIYLQQEGRGIGLANKIASYALQDGGMDTVDANLHLGFKDEQREYTVVPDILKDINVIITYPTYTLIITTPCPLNLLRTPLLTMPLGSVDTPTDEQPLQDKRSA